MQPPQSATSSSSSNVSSKMTRGGIFMLEFYESMLFLGLILIANGFTIQTVLDIMKEASADKNIKIFNDARGAAVSLYSLGILLLAIGLVTYIYYKYLKIDKM